MKHLRTGLVTLVLAVLTTLTLALPAGADVGPKPSVTVKIQGLEGRRYAVTLLSDAQQYGPWSARPDYQDWMGDRALYEAFASYRPPAGWYFQGHYQDCTGTDRFSWSYYPPQRFYVLIYLPDSGEYLLSPEPCERYAFDSAFTAAAGENGSLTVTSSYNYGPELLSLAARIAVTIAVEAAVGWLLFGLRGRPQLRVILVTNAVTQVLLNLLLNLCGYQGGPWMFVFAYVWAELAVFLLEGAVYRSRLPWPDGRRPHPWLYALAANAVSFAAGLGIARILPGIF